jgi:uncharacterized protein YjgD (DUF1641 family)
MEMAVMDAPGTHAGQELIARLERPDTAAALNHLLDRLDVIVLAADAADGLLRRGDVLTDSVAGGLAELRKVPISPDLEGLAGKLPQLAHTGMQVAGLAGSPAVGRLLSSGLLERLGDPKTIASLHTFLDNLEIASFALSAINGFLERSDVIIDSVTDSMADAKKLAPGFDPGKINELAAALPALAEVAVQVSKSGLLEQVKALTETLDAVGKSGISAPATLGVVGELGAAARTAREKKEYTSVVPKGIFGLMGALRDPDVQASLGFAIAFARNYGRRLRATAEIGSK